MGESLLAQRLIEARERIGLNRRQLAEKLNIPYSTVTNYERGMREPGGQYLITIANLCGCTTDWLLGMSEQPQESAQKKEAPIREPQPFTMNQIDALLSAFGIDPSGDIPDDVLDFFRSIITIVRLYLRNRH